MPSAVGSCLYGLGKVSGPPKGGFYFQRYGHTEQRTWAVVAVRCKIAYRLLKAQFKRPIFKF
jgi:hypothetical protein